jgi:hypothetical protein
MTSTPIGLAELLDYMVADVVAHGVLVPDRAIQQVLPVIGRRIAGVLGDRPAVFLGSLARGLPDHHRWRPTCTTQSNAPDQRPHQGKITNYG